MRNNRWLLPEGIEEALPEQARRIESLRRRLLDLYAGWGYELVMPPFIEYLDSLLIGTGNDLDLHTFKLTDPQSGRMLGVRADITPQVARIDAHHLGREVPVRLCYVGTVLRTQPPFHGGSRSPLQVGVELYGHQGVESDLEVLGLLVQTLHGAGISPLHLDLGHVGIFRSLTAGLDEELEADLFDALQRKAKPELGEILAKAPLDAVQRECLLALADLNGGVEVLEEAAARLAGTGEEVDGALAELRRVAEFVASLEGVSLNLDLGELRGYRYHTGLVFAAFVSGQGQAIAQGGRYDHIGEVFGRARPATGFSTDLKALIALVDATEAPVRGIFAPFADDPALRAEVAVLREAGERVVQALPGQVGDAAAMGCDRELRLHEGRWQVTAAT